MDAMLPISVAAGWNQTEKDWARLLELNPDLAWGIECEGQLASTITAYLDPEGWAWIGMVLTLPAFRGQGMARRLLDHLLGELDRAGIKSIGLDATPMGEPVYKAYGFTGSRQLERWAREGVPLDSLESDSGIEYRKPLHALLARDGAVWCEGDSQLYVRPGWRANHCGPFFAPDEEEARRLLDRVPAEASLYWDLLADNPVARKLARSMGLVPVRTLTRMWRGPTVEIHPPEQIANSSFEYGC